MVARQGRSAANLIRRLFATVAAAGLAPFAGGQAALAAPADAPAPAAAPARKPNLVLFIADDLTQDDIGVYGGDARTPNIDQMARDGLQFQDAFASSPTCSVSRSSLLTGDYPMHHGGHALGSVIRSGIATLPQILAKQGYRVVIAGKTHFGPPKDFPFEYLGDTVTVPAGKRGVLWSKLDMSVVDRLLATRDRAKPLALIVASFASHVRWPENEGYDPAKLKLPGNLLDTPDTRAVRTMYLTKVTLADTELGELRASMRKYGMADNTLLMFTADQGAQFPLAKWNLYDAGTRTPLIAVWNGHVAAGGKTSALVSLVDLLPTWEEAAGGPPLPSIDGRSLMPVLEGKADRFRGEIFTAHSGDVGQRPERNVAPMRAIRTDRYKLIVNFYPDIPFKDAINVNTRFIENSYWLTWRKLAQGGDRNAAAIVAKFEHRPPTELYDLQRDPYEMHNLAGDAALKQTEASLHDRLFQWMREQGEDPAHVAMPDAAPRGPIPYTAKGEAGGEDQ